MAAARRAIQGRLRSAPMRSSAAVPWDRFLASTTRRVGVVLALRVVLGGILGPVGWGVAAFGSVFVWIFGVPDIVVDLVDRPTDLVPVQAVVERAEPTNLQVNEETVYAFHLRAVVDGVERRGVVYRTGSSHRLSPDASVAAQASRTRDFILTDGTRPTQMPWGGVFLGALPLVGLVMVAFAWARHLRGVALLRSGAPAQGKLVRTEPTGATVNDRPVLRYVFTFTDAAGRAHEVSANSHVSDFLVDQAREPVLYDRADPSRAVLLGGLPGDPRVADDGSVTCGDAARVVLLLLPPLAFVAIHALGVALS